MYIALFNEEITRDAIIRRNNPTSGDFGKNSSEIVPRTDGSIYQFTFQHFECHSIPAYFEI